MRLISSLAVGLACTIAALGLSTGSVAPAVALAETQPYTPVSVAPPERPEYEPTPTLAPAPIVRRYTITAYCSCHKCCHKTDGITASGKPARHGTLASPLPFGTRIRIPGYGVGVVEDRGGAIVGDRIDVWHSSHQAAREWGVRRLECEVLP